MNKVLIKLYVPIMEYEYDVWIPVNKKVHNVILLLLKGLNELSTGEYEPTKMPMLYDKMTAKLYNINLTVKENNIINGSELILI